MTAPLDRSAQIEHSPDSAWRVVEGQAVIIHADVQRMRVLNEVGSRVWELCDGRTLQEIVDKVCSEFDAPAEQVAADVDAFVRELLDKKMVQIRPAKQP